MFDWMLPEKHAIAILKADHDKVKDLFDRFERAEHAAEKEDLIQQAVAELKMHAIIEEEIFYPAVRKHVGTDIMNEADEGHHVARVLIAELDARSGGGDHREAKFQVLAENVRLHVKEEEDEMLPKAKDLDIDFVKLGERMLKRKQEMQERGIPSDAEHTMVAAVHGKGDSPAQKAAVRKTAKKTVARRSAKSASSKTRKAGH